MEFNNGISGACNASGKMRKLYDILEKLKKQLFWRHRHWQMYCTAYSNRIWMCGLNSNGSG
jgi:hypothetical protein